MKHDSEQFWSDTESLRADPRDSTVRRTEYSMYEAYKHRVLSTALLARSAYSLVGIANIGYEHRMRGEDSSWNCQGPRIITSAVYVVCMNL